MGNYTDNKAEKYLYVYQGDPVSTPKPRPQFKAIFIHV